jgi:hypothetical protein
VVIRWLATGCVEGQALVGGGEGITLGSSNTQELVVFKIGSVISCENCKGAKVGLS